MIHKISTILTSLVLFLTCLDTFAQKTDLQRIHENIRETLYPQTGHQLYLNPSPLLVPQSAKTSEMIQFQLSSDKNFSKARTMTSKPVPWLFFNPHKTLTRGTWYWRYRSISEEGETSWSEPVSFTVTGSEPSFVTPPFETFLQNLPKQSPRLYCFLEADLERERETISSHPEYKEMCSRASMGLKYEIPENPYSDAGKIATMVNYLHTAYETTRESQYSDKMLEIVRAFIPAVPDTDKLKDDFYAGDIIFILTHIYDSCNDLLSIEEKDRLKEIILNVAKYHHDQARKGNEETHIFDNHFWQRTYREMLQVGLLFADTDSWAREALEYCYELWTARAPASGFNRDGEWHNGTGYFNANSKTLYYVPSLFSYVTGTDFLQHPWYKNAGKAMLYNWPVGTMSAGFGDQNEKWNEPDRQRMAFVDYLARELKDPYAAWYASRCTRILRGDYDSRLYRMARGRIAYPNEKALPAGSAKALWMKDIGQVAAHSALQNTSRNLFLSFRSSQFGSGSHTLADQNSFNIHFRGVPVFRSTGYYLNFSDAHNLMSYRHTRASNSILINGIGQPFTTRAYGKITRMVTGENITYALGDASNAYCGTSEYKMWEENFANAGLTQTPDNGFGETPLKKYRRHIFLLHPYTVVIYDELESSENVRWDWLLHSPVEFDIDQKNGIVRTRNDAKEFSASVQLFSNIPCSITQTDQFAVEPDVKKYAKKGTEDKYVNQWHMSATYQDCAKNRILTIIKILPDGSDGEKKTYRKGNNFTYERWKIVAEMDPSKPASISIVNTRNNATFHLGEEDVKVDGNSYSRLEDGSAVLYDCVDGEWMFQEVSDSEPLPTGKM